MTYKTVLGAAGSVMTLVGYAPYVGNTLTGRTRPHVFSWLVWSSVTAIAFAGQLVEKAGPGSWVTGVSTLVCVVIFGAALRQGEKDIALVDWMSLGGAAVALALWAVTERPLAAVVLVTLVDALGFLPTFRKSFFRPFEETALTYSISVLRWLLAILALQNLSVVTWLYPASLVVMNAVFVALLLVRRRQLCSTAGSAPRCVR
jgi:hypothetical protein